MKRNSVNFVLYTLGALSLLQTAHAAGVYALDDEDYLESKQAQEQARFSAVKTPVFLGGITASIGALYLVSSANDQASSLFTVDEEGNTVTQNFDTEYAWGIDASIGYIFPDTANDIELFYRGVNPDASQDEGDLSEELNAVDLMMSQFIDIGHWMQMRFMGGVSYVDIEQTENRTFETSTSKNDSHFTGWGPRIGLDSRYDFGNGFGIVGGGSGAYYLGDLNITTTDFNGNTHKDDRDNQGVFNFRANLGIDYIYAWSFMSDEDDREHMVMGLELGYLIDYYDNAVGIFNKADNPNPDTSAISFSGPYVNLKAIF